MYGLLEKLELRRIGIPKKTRYGIILLLAVLSFAFLFVGGGLSNNLMLGLIIVFILVSLALGLETKRAICAAVVFAFFCISLYIRTVPSHDAVFLEDWVKFGGNDPWYNMRIVENLVQHFPHRISYDAYTLFPTGQNVPFAPFFDWLLAFAIWVIGAGHPDMSTIETVGAYFPAVLGALVIIPVYFIGRELFSRTAGLIAAGMIAVMPGEFLFRSLLGFTDHHIAEVLFSTTTVMFFIFTIKHAKRNEISFSHFRAGEWKSHIQNSSWLGLIRSPDWGSLRKPLLFALLTGFSLGIYLLSWIGGLILVLIFGGYIVIQYIMDHLRGRSNDYLCIIGIPIFLVSLIMVLSFLDLLRFGHWATAALPLGMLALIVLSGVSRLMQYRNIRRGFYPVAVVVLGLVGLGLFKLIDPSLLNSMLARFSIFNPSVTQLTIMEAQPVLSDWNPQTALGDTRLWRYFTTGLFVVPLSLLLMTYEAGENRRTGFMLAGLLGAVIALTLLVSHPWDMPSWFRYVYYIIFGLVGLVYAYHERDRGRILLVIWSAVMLVAMLGQTRFAYYCAVNATIFMAYFCWKMPWMLSTILEGVWRSVKSIFSSEGAPVDKRKKRKAEKRERAKRGDYSEQKESAVIRADYRKVIRYVSVAVAVIAVFFLAFKPNIDQAKILADSPWGPNKHWHEALVWMRYNTPEPFGDPDAYYQLYEKPAKGEPYDYPDSAYGVMSWWDYGHWITRMAHRIPNANPFQSGIGGPRRGSYSYGASTFLTAQNESSGSKMLDALGSKYIAIDIETATTKFHTPVTWSGQNSADYYSVYYAATAEGTRRFVFYGVPYYQSMCTRLYNFGTEAVVPNNSTWAISYAEGEGAAGNVRRVVTDIANNGEPFPTYEEAAAFLEDNPDFIIVGVHPFLSPVPLEKLEHYELVYETDKTDIRWLDIPFHYVRIFEYIP